MGGGLGTAILGEGLLEAVQHALKAESAGPLRRGTGRSERRVLERLRQRLEAKTECSACAQQREHEDYALLILLSMLTTPTWREWLARSDGGLCLPHLRMALGRAETVEGIAWLVADQRRRMSALLTDLTEYTGSTTTVLPRKVPGRNTTPARGPPPHWPGPGSSCRDRPGPGHDPSGRVRGSFPERVRGRKD
jgi:hypothetical protein